MFDLSTEEIRVIVNELDQAIYNHEEWSKRLTRTLVCNLPSDEYDLTVDAHRHCLFGQWYYNRASPSLHKLPGFVAIDIEHQHMHEQAAKLLQDAAAGVAISPAGYDNFENALERMRLQIHTLRREFTERLYNCDPLTGVNSRLGLLTSLREHHELVKRNTQSCAIAMMDIDHFKMVNDQYGHLGGDKVLSSSAGYLMNHSRSYDKAFRYGGEEFVICMPGLELEQAFSFIERLRVGIAENVVIYDGHEIRVTASFGVAMLEAGISVEDCLERADKALYTAKSAGRNCTRVWTEEMVVLSPRVE
ncbi:diguanylate cyclase [Methylophaga sp. OBS4]|uniref:diguanylate cyclase n=1 Tax=Methylophaga sp. OBS4 TaxID=2991935 RepID=UPI002258F656|nr:diguanylate cyclase [Methylophaga sp. OBS4]MCX4188514.1 diguanylate cyclase [Methylophaga sp. OBS4]